MSFTYDSYSLRYFFSTMTYDVSKKDADLIKHQETLSLQPVAQQYYLA